MIHNEDRRVWSSLLANMESIMKYLVIYCVFLTIFLGCSATGVKTEYKKISTLAGLQTYDWLQTDSQPGENVRVNDPLVIDAVRNAVEANLEKKGYRKVEGGQADFLVTWFGAIEKKVHVESIDHFYRGYGYGPVAQQMATTGDQGNTTTEFEEGTILIDILNPMAYKTQWRGTGSRRLLKERGEDDAVLYIDRVVGQIFKNFPQAAN